MINVVGKKDRPIRRYEDNALPHNTDMEEAVLGAILMDNTALPRAKPFLKEDYFYKEVNSIIFSAINHLWDSRTPIDILTVTNHLRNIGKLELCGGAYYISQLTNRVASSANIEAHSAVIADCGIRRAIIAEGSRSAAEAYDSSIDVFSLLDRYEKRIREATSITGTKDSSTVSRMQRVAKLIGEGFDRGFRGTSWGHDSFDAFLGGLTPKLIFIGGRPGMGKTSLALWLAHQIGKTGRVLFYSLEMDADSLGIRETSMYSGIPYERIEQVRFDAKTMVYLQSMNDKIAKMANVEVYDDPHMDMSKLRAQVKQAKIKMPDTKAIFIDYIQLMKIHMAFQSESKASAVGELSRELKLLSKEVGLPIIALSQLSRSVESRSDKRPMMSDLKESGGLEADADIILFPFREEHYDSEATDQDGNPTKGRVEIGVAKNRGGKTGHFWMRCDIGTSNFDFDPYKPYTKANNNDYDSIETLTPNDEPPY